MVVRKTKLINTRRLDEDLFLLEELLKDEMYEKSEKSLYQFIINFWNTFEPSPLVNNWHIECIAEHVQAALKRQIRRVIVNVPPRSGKSIISSICAPVWGFLNQPHEKFWLISHSAKLFIQNIVYARRILEHPLYKDRWCNKEDEENFRFSIATDVNTKTRIETDMGGYLLGGSPTSGALGMGYSVAILDDIMDSEKAYNPGEIENINNWYTQTFLNRSNNVNNDVIFIIMQRLSSCFLPETLVKTDSGLKEIQHLTYLDKVYTSNHKYEEILNISEKQVNPNIVEIKPIGMPYTLKVTNEHKVRTYDALTKEYIWKAAKELTIKDKLTYPIRTKQKDINLTELWDEDIVRKNNKQFYSGSATYLSGTPAVDKDKVIEAFNICGNHIQKVAKYLGVHRNSLANYLKYYDLDYLANKNNYLPASVVYTEEFWRIVGYWVAEGWLSEYLVAFAFHSEELEYINYIADFCNKYNIKCSIKPVKEANCTRVYFSSIQFSNFLRDNFKELAEHKVIPDWMFDIDDNYIKQFLLGYIQGDGTIRKSKTSVATVSKNLAEGVFNLFLRLGIPCYWTKTKKGKNFDVQEVFVHNYYVKDWIYKQDTYITDEYSKQPRYLHNYIDEINNTFVIKIRSIKQVNSFSNVWDITTPTGDFVAEGVLVHNSDLTDYVTKTYGEQDWFVLNLPAKFEPERVFVSPIGYADKRTRKGQLLDPVRLPDEFLVTQAKNPKIYNTRYQQNPDAEGDGNLLKAEYIVERDRKPHKFTALITVWDLSFTDAPESTYTVGLVVGKYEDEYHVIDMFRDKCAIPEQLDAIRKLKAKYPSAVVGVEKKSNGHAAMSLLEREIKDIYGIEPRLFGGKKEQRFDSIIPYFRDRKIIIYNPFHVDIFVEDTFNSDIIKKELKAFPIGKYDDIVDCLSYAVQWLAEYGAESQGIITGGQKIQLADEDFIDKYKSKSYNIFNPDDLFDSSSIPSKEDLAGIMW